MLVIMGSCVKFLGVVRCSNVLIFCSFLRFRGVSVCCSAVRRVFSRQFTSTRFSEHDRGFRVHLRRDLRRKVIFALRGFSVFSDEVGSRKGVW